MNQKIIYSVVLAVLFAGLVLAGVMVTHQRNTSTDAAPPEQAAPEPAPVQPAPAEEETAAPENTPVDDVVLNWARPVPAAPEPQMAFSVVVEKARLLAETSYEAPESSLPGSVTELNYDAYRRIEYRREAADWANGASQFQIQYDPQGFLFKNPIKINLVENGEAAPRPFRPEDFNFFDLPITEEDRQALGFAGFRVTTPLNAAGKFDDLINFRGASFFRVLAAGTHYGASARGIAVSTASTSGEEFPAFREFWILKPQPGASAIIIYALLDGPSLSGAYRFTVEPGGQTVVDVDMVLFPRRGIADFGIAPITSMFDFAPHDPADGRQDYRPEVHDSDGLMVRLHNGESVWRPLINPRELQVSVFARQAPLGFGLMQRQRQFAAYQDLEADYHHRPSVWVAPKGQWGDGALTLIEIPTSNEYNDNIVAFWQPSTPLEKGKAARFGYRMYWGLEAPMHPSVPKISDTRAGMVPDSKNRLFVIDFQSQDWPAPEAMAAEVSASTGEILNKQIVRNRETGGLRLTFQHKPEGVQSAELRAQLTRAGQPASETWLYRWTPR